MADLFDGLAPVDPQPKVTYSPGALRSLTTLRELWLALPLRQRTANMYGKVLPVPRLESWHGQRPYAFGGRVEQPQPWPPLLLEVKRRVEGLVGFAFDSCFANLYRDGRDSIAWHADDEPWIGEPIASVTFGAARRFVMRHNATKAKTCFLLGDGDLLVMHEGTQRAWQHSVPRTEAVVGPRLNLTFRITRPT